MQSFDDSDADKTYSVLQDIQKRQRQRHRCASSSEEEEIAYFSHMNAKKKARVAAKPKNLHEQLQYNYGTNVKHGSLVMRPNIKSIPLIKVRFF